MGKKTPNPDLIAVKFGEITIELDPDNIDPQTVLKNIQGKKGSEELINVFSQVARSYKEKTTQFGLFPGHLKTAEEKRQFIEFLVEEYTTDSDAGETMSGLSGKYGKDKKLTAHLDLLKDEFSKDPVIEEFFELLEADIEPETEEETEEEEKSKKLDEDGNPIFSPRVIKDIKTKFKDLGGMDEIREEVEDIIHFIKNPKEIEKKGGKVPKALLMAGPPGTGKTLTARAIAGECNIPFIQLHAPQLRTKWIGDGRDRVEKIFELAKEQIEKQKKEGKTASCIIFVDEIDAIGTNRNGSGNNDSEVIDELLVQMDGFEHAEGITLIAATNRPEALDAALIDRFGENLILPLPTQKGRRDILKIHTKNMPLKKEVDLNQIAKKTFSFSGRNLAALVNKAAMNAAKKPETRKVGLEDFNIALDKVNFGTKRNLKIPIEEKEATAVHEAGHAIAGLLLEYTGFDPLNKVTILPHDDALGLTHFVEDKESYSSSLKKLKAALIVDYAGRVAEEIIYGAENVSSGAMSDIENATEQAKRMVTQYGFNEKLGPIKIGGDHESYLGSVASKSFDSTVLGEIQSLVNEAYEATENLLTENRTALIDLAEALMEHEMLERDEVIAVTGIEPKKPKPIRLSKIKRDI